MVELMVLVFTVLVTIIVAYFDYGIFAEHIGLLLKNKKEWGVSVRDQLKLLFKRESKK